MKLSLRIGPVERLTLGVVSLVVSMLMILNLIFNAVPDRVTMKRQLRKSFAESLTVQVASIAEINDLHVLNRTLQQVMERDPEVVSIAVRQASGSIIAQQGDHEHHWVPPDSGRSTLNQIRVPINNQGKLWGSVEIAFMPATPQSARAWLDEPMIQLLGAFTIGGLVIFYPYLRRAMHFLDPSATIPDRVRKAFDALTDGVVVLAPDGRIVLANSSFRKIHPDCGQMLNGHKLSQLAWLQNITAHESTPPPWEKLLRDGKPIEGYPLTIAQPQGDPTKMIVGCSPVTDNNNRLRGCLVTFHDVTEIHHANEQLRVTLGELEKSREKIQAQNEELRVLATRDPMTGCFNRRAFFETANTLFAQASQTNEPTACIMTDIDHFKKINDTYGHSVGDQVIQAVARTLSRNTRAQDVLCRYGGEEFCILLPGTTVADARIIAERIRSEVEKHTVEAIRSTRVDKITSSFGIGLLAPEIKNLEELIDRADNALYKSKEDGRNRVTVWENPAV